MLGPTYEEKLSVPPPPPTPWDSNQPAQLQGLARKFKISLVARLHMVLSKNQITKALIRLCGCAGWSVPLLFAYPRRRGPYYHLDNPRSNCRVPGIYFLFYFELKLVNKQTLKTLIRCCIMQCLIWVCTLCL